MNIVEPIGDEKEAKVISTLCGFLQQAETLFGRQFERIPVSFDLTGRAAGMYVFGPKGRYIRFNPYIFAKFFEDNLETTVPHEVAHYVSDVIYGMRHIRPHGAEWRQIMRDFGVMPHRTCNYDLSGVPIRRYQRFPYQCGCADHMLTSRRHNKIRRGLARYSCPRCGDFLRLSEQGKS